MIRRLLVCQIAKQVLVWEEDEIEAQQNLSKWEYPILNKIIRETTLTLLQESTIRTCTV